MDLCDISQIKGLLAQHGFHFSKAKGQNFLVQAWVPQRIALESGASPECGVLEVGPGIGCLTQELSQCAGHVCAVEVDTALKPILAQTLRGCENVSIVYGDILKLDLAELVAAQFPDARPMACANLPYYITSPILSALLESRLFSAVTVMVQREVALRICAAPGTPDYSAFTIFCNYYAKPELLFDVPPDCFLPRPKVTSSVLRLSVYDKPPCELLSEPMLFRTVRAGFAMRRKTACNALAAGFPLLGREGVSAALTACGHQPGIRCETLSLQEFAALANELYRREQYVSSHLS